MKEVHDRLVDSVAVAGGLVAEIRGAVAWSAADNALQEKDYSKR